MKGKANMLRAAAAAVVLLAMGGSANADSLVDEKAVPGKFSANVALTSEYYFRGISQTDDKPALQGGMDYELEIAKSGISGYLGFWGSNVDFNDGNAGANIEIDIYGGLRGKVGSTPLGWDVGFIYYAYPGAASSFNYDFWEVQGALSYDFGIASVTGSVNYSPENFGDTNDATYVKLGVDVPVGKYLTMSGYVAKQFLDAAAGDDYLEWNISAGVNLAGFDLSLAYSDTDISPSSDGNGAAVLFTVSRSF